MAARRLGRASDTPPMNKADRPGALPLRLGFRELGGLSAEKGQRIAYRMLYRSANLELEKSDEYEVVYQENHTTQFRALNIGTIVDLRTPHEELESPSGWPKATGGSRISVPILDGVAGSSTDIMGDLFSGKLSVITPEDLGAMYVTSLKFRATAYGLALTAIAEAERLPVLVHCASGKDRTGLVVAVLLASMGCTRQEIVEDYQLTGLYRKDRIIKYVPALESHGINPDDVRAFFETPEEAINIAMDFVETEFGGAERYLMDAAKVSQAAMGSLRSRLLVSAP